MSFYFRFFKFFGAEILIIKYHVLNEVRLTFRNRHQEFLIYILENDPDFLSGPELSVGQTLIKKWYFIIRICTPKN